MTPEQHKEARASLQGVIERAAALNFDADRFAELHEQHTNAQFVAGWNLPGCLPEMEPATFETAAEAREFIANELYDLAQNGDDDISEEDANAHRSAIEGSKSPSGSVQSGPYVYWWNPNETPDEAKEYADLCAVLAELDLTPDEADEAQDRARERIQESALSVEVRTDWHAPGTTADEKPTEFNILLSTGGPATRIIGELDEHGTPDRARFEFQDWHIPWSEVVATGDESDALLSFAQCFFFGE